MKYNEEEDVKLSLVCSTDKLPPPVGSCSCGGNPILSESKQFQLIHNNYETFCKVRGGFIEFTKLQIGCCTGQRGHNCSLMIKAELIREGSSIRGLIAYSDPIDVGAKGPFAKIFVKNQTAPEDETINESEKQIVEISTLPTASYEGAEEMINLLKKLNLQKYIHLFTAQEVDIQAFLQLTDSDLNEIGIIKVGPRIKILKEISRLKEPRQIFGSCLPQPESIHLQLQNQTTNDFETTFSLPRIPSLPSLPISDTNNPQSSLSSPTLASFFQDEGLTTDQLNKKRKASEAFSSNNSLADMENEKPMSIYIYLSHIVAANNILKKTLFMAKSEKNKWETEQIVQQIQQQVVSDITQKGKQIFHEGKAQLMLLLQPDKNGDWVAKSIYSSQDNQVWNFKKGDYIKIDNHHNVDISINVHYYYIPSAGKNGSDKLFVEDFRSPKKYPTLFPGGSLEIGVDENRDGRLALAAELNCEPSETFAVTKNGKLVQPSSSESTMFNETCSFSFKRRKDNMKKAESFDDFQKEIFLSKCLDPTIM